MNGMIRVRFLVHDHPHEEHWMPAVPSPGQHIILSDHAADDAPGMRKYVVGPAVWRCEMADTGAVAPHYLGGERLQMPRWVCEVNVSP